MNIIPVEHPRYQSHFLMTKADVALYTKEKLQVFTNDPIAVEEIGDGNINYVFRVVDETTNESFVIKQADKLLRSSGRPLDIERNRIESEILQIQYELAPDLVPEVYYYDEQMYAVVMEDISDYQNMRYQLIAGNIFPNFAEAITDYLARTLLPTTDLILDRAVKKERIKEFINIEMCDISEDLVFTEPYVDYKKRNVITPGNEKFVTENLYQNEPLQTEVAQLRNQFMNCAQALIHGDLHTGSIFINQTGLKVIDPEFAFYGPIGYDIGNVLAHLYFPLVLKLFTEPSGESFTDWLLETISQVYELTQTKLAHVYEEQVTFPLYQSTAFEQMQLNQIMNDALGYAGTEIIRRVVGDSKVKEMSLFASDEKIAAERLLIRLGIQLITKRNELNSGEQLVQNFKALMREGI